MKNKYWLISVFVVLIIFTAHPVCSHAAPSDEVNFVNTDVECTIEAEYSFTLPSNVVLQYPQTNAIIGFFGVGELLLESGETLSIELVPGLMTAEEDASVSLPYTVAFSTPAAINEAQSGDEYSVTIAIDSDAFEAAVFSSYEASLVFRVRSQLSSDIVWTGTTQVTAQMNQDSDDG